MLTGEINIDNGLEGSAFSLPYHDPDLVTGQDHGTSDGIASGSPDETLEGIAVVRSAGFSQEEFDRLMGSVCESMRSVGKHGDVSVDDMRQGG